MQPLVARCLASLLPARQTIRLNTRELPRITRFRFKSADAVHLLLKYERGAKGVDRRRVCVGGVEDGHVQGHRLRATTAVPTKQGLE